MNHSTRRAGWRRSLTGAALVALLVATSTALGMGNVPAMSMAEVQQTPENEPAASTGRRLRLPEKPAGLDDVGWDSLQQAVRKEASQQAKLTAGSVAGADGAAFDEFGYSVALSGDTALVGAYRDDVGAISDQGSAYVFTRSGATWTLQQKLTAGDDPAADLFGYAVALSGDTALVGANWDDVGVNSDQGSAYVFTRSGSTWTLQQKLTAADGAAFDQFGGSVALSGDTALVGAISDSVGGNSVQGSAYVFTRIGTTWTQQAQLTAGDGAAVDQFGWSLAVSGDTALVGAVFDDVGANSDQGSAYVFTRSGTTWTLQQKLTAGDGAASDQFGLSVALSGDTALVGAYRDDIGAISDQGSAYVFTRSGATWTLQQKLTAGDGAASDWFGYAVALSGDTALVGARLDDVGATNQGSAYVFMRSGTTWAQQQKLTAGDGAASDGFGYAVALSGDTMLLGANGDDTGVNSDQGSAYVYTRSGMTWTQQAKLTAGDGAASDFFGFSVALDGDTALVGVQGDDVGANVDQGSAYVFTRIGTTWTQQAQLTAGDGAAFDQFGYAVALSGDTALVGSVSGDVGANSNQGSAYVYTRSGTTWTQQAKLTAGDGAASDFFGFSVALDGDTALVGVQSDDVGANVDQGSAYVFTRIGTTWTQQAQLTAGDGAAFDQFGFSVALSGDTALVGSVSDDVGANSNQGSAYVYTRSGTTWTQQAHLTAADGTASDLFGRALALDGDTALVGAPFDDVGANADQGSGYVFTRGGTTWTQQEKLTAGDGAASDQFGSSVALSGNTALVGARSNDVGANNDQGSAYVYMRSGTTWTQQQILTAGDGAAGDFLGFSLALSNGAALVGAYLADGLPPYGNANEGAAYAFSGVGLLPQIITFANPGAQTFGKTPTLSATASSGLPVTFTSATTGVCTITAGGTLSFLTTGTCTINADQAGDATYDAAPRVSQSFAVINAPIDAVNDSGTVANGASGGVAVADVLLNDTLNDAPATLASVTLTQLSTSNPNITLNSATGAVAVAAATPAGTYTLTYQICEQLNPTNCDNATATVTVGAAIIDAVNDSGTVANGASGGVAVADVLLNDTLNAAAATLASVTLTQLSTSNPNITLNPATGAVSVAAATPAGTYTLTYRICEQLNPTNCDDATATVTVGAAIIDAVNDSGTVANGASGGVAVADVLLNDTLNAAAATLTSVTLTQLSTSNPNITLNPATGAVAVAAATPAGTYTLTYRICEQLNPTNCDNAIATITVGAAPIDAVDEDYTGTQVNGASGGTLPTVLVNDTLNGGAATVGDGGNVTLTPGAAPTPDAGSIAMNVEGTITIAAGTTAGVYTYAYTICEVLNPTNCDTAIASVTVGAAIIDAVNDSGTVANGAAGGTAVANVLVNDTLNDAAATLASVTLTQLSTSNPNIALNPATGAVAVAAATPAGTYTLTYQACEQLNPTNCDSATVSVTVNALAPTTADSSVTVGYNASATSVPLTLGGGAATSLTVVTPPAKGTANVSGTTITYQPNAAFAGPDNFTYTATNSGGTSAPATVTITVQDPVITITPSGGLSAAVASPYTRTYSFDGGAPPWSEYQVTNLPAGLSITGTTANTVTISGTPTQAGSFTLNVSATDSSTGNGPFTVGQAFGLTVDAILPGAPSIGAATAGDGEASVSFGEPAFTGGAPITGYTVTSNPGGLTGTGATSPITVTGLSNGVAYTFSVTATNSAGTGAASEASNAVTPRGPQAALTAIATPSTVAFGATSALSASGGSGGGEVSYAITAGAAFCSLSGSTLTATAIGTCTVTATKAAEGAFNAATATVDVTVVRAEQAALTATASPSSIAFGGASALGTTGGSGTGAVSFAVTAGGEFCSISSTTLTGTGVGTCTVTATKAADVNFNAATVTVDVTVGRADQALLTATASPSSIAFGGTSTLATTGGSGAGAVSYAISGGSEFCSITGTTLTGIGVGTCTVTATKAADANFNAATATVSVTVARANQAPLSVTATPSAIPLTRTTALSATGGSGTGDVSFAVTAGAANCTISGSTLTGTGVGACTVVATKAGDAQFNPATAQATVVVQAATDLEISKDDGTQYALPQGTVLYEILVANAGPLAVEGARLRDVLPAGLADALWTCTPLQLAACPQAAGEGGIDQTLTLPVNGVLRYRLSARVTAPLGSTLTNTATIDAPTGVIELQSSDNSASDSNLVVPEGLFGNGFEAAPNRISVPVRGL
ncbi:MAG: fibronectin type III domain-containing protein [Xanthomonadales bacterium]|nr:fibronectin type III domain-containing protein [Xanthomonadales bacterium]